jgi:hypothetical protein
VFLLASFRRWHRRLSLVVGIQLLFWTGSGLFFSIFPIEEIRGNHLLAEGGPQLRLQAESSMNEIEASAAARLALKSPAPLARALLIEEAPNEYRGGDLPAWRVDFEDGVSIYLDPMSAKVNAVRTPIWRTYDFLWMLHIMDYDERSDFNHPLLIAAALLGFLTSLTGLVLTWYAWKPRPKKGE